MVTESNIKKIRSGWNEHLFGRSGATEYVAKKVGCSKQTVLNALSIDKPLSKLHPAEINALEAVEELTEAVKKSPRLVLTALKERNYEPIERII